MTKAYYEPMLQPIGELADPVPFHDDRFGFETLRCHQRGRASFMVHALDCEEETLAPFINAPAFSLEQRSLIMGIVNITPDSFSDGGAHFDPEASIRHAEALVAAGADILDFGAESTRPGADFVSASEELRRLDAALDRMDSFGVATSVDTRKAAVADAAIGAGVTMINDVSAMSFDPDMIDVVARSGTNICLMHAQGDPKTMQEQPEYDDVILDIYDYLEDRIETAEACGIDRARIVIDPGIGFGKTLAHNLAILRHIALFHSLGCPILVGASRKRMIGEIGGGEADARLGGSLAIALAMARKAVQIIRVHDVQETVQALKIDEKLREQN